MPQPLAVDMRSTSHEFGSAHAINNTIRLPSNPINNRPEKINPGTNPNYVQGAMAGPSYGTPLSCHTCYASDLGSYSPSLDCNSVIPEETGNQYLFTQYNIFGDFNSGQVGPRSYLPGQTGRCNAGGYQPCSDQLFNSTPSTDYGYSDFYSPDERIQFYGLDQAYSIPLKSIEKPPENTDVSPFILPSSEENQQRIWEIENDESTPTSSESPCEEHTKAPKQKRVLPAKSARVSAAQKLHLLANYDLPTYDGVKLSFNSQHEASAASQDRIADSELDWSSPQDDDTLPTTDEERSEVVRRLLGAMLETNHCKDPGSRSFAHRWKEGSTFYHVEDMERVCWEIQEFAEKLHREGPRILSIHDKNYLGIVAKTKDLKFSDRIQLIMTLMVEFKSRCDKLMRGGAVQEYVAAPQEVLRTGRVNIKSNKDRQAYLIVGRKAKMAEKAKSAEAKASSGRRTRKRAHSEDPEDEDEGISHGIAERAKTRKPRKIA
ncbi:hypothetical protein BS50DRAFT_636223 [Corynespora cassiicola Philippines]|uniref:Uncharacterized protein n=1 Tax=Corynespora cassiicola Philippines TaxID=1448308 RepID=A0A2T2NJ84_CORCC|nr:hypothetical protein BS50DRAFT_636223 [Corynespora cassiicola Philippines]